MKLNSDSNRVYLIQSITAASSQLSSMASLARKYIVDKFPKEFFKHFYVDTARTITENKRNESYNHNVQKIQYPSLTESIEFSLDDTFQVKNWGTSDVYLGLRTPLDKNYVSIYRDQLNRAQLYATSEYITSKFRFRIAVNSYVQNVDVANYINSRFRRDFFQYLGKQHINTEIPKTIIEMIADMNSLNLDNPDDLKKLSIIVGATSRTPRMIRKTISATTGKVSYFLEDEREILMYFTDLDVPATIIRDDMSEGEYILEFTLQTTAWQINNFIFSLRKDIYISGGYHNWFANDCIINGDNITLSDKETAEPDFYVSPILDVPLLDGKMCTFIDAFNNEQIGSMIKNDIFMRPVNYTPKDGITINYLDSMPEEYKKLIPFIKEHLSTKSMTQLFKYKLLTLNGELKEGTDFIVDYYEMSVKMINFVDSEVRALLYINRLFYEMLLVCMETGKEYGNISDIGTWDINPYDNYKIRILVERLNTKSYKKDNMLRLMTKKGVGYIPLLPVDDSAVSVRICTNVNKDGVATIKQLKEV